MASGGQHWYYAAGGVHPRALKDCSECFSQQDHTAILDREKEMTMQLAQLFPVLRIVLWADTWGNPDESVESDIEISSTWQRPTYVRRDNGQIYLTKHQINATRNTAIGDDAEG